MAHSKLPPIAEDESAPQRPQRQHAPDRRKLQFSPDVKMPSEDEVFRAPASSGALSTGSNSARMLSWLSSSAQAKVMCRSKSFDSDMQRRAEAVIVAFKRPAWWVLIFGWTLAICAGIVNAVSLRTFGHFVSHATGATTSIALGIQGFADGRHGWEEPSDALQLLGSFLAGAFACGLLIDKNQVHIGGKALYGAALVGNSLLLVVSMAVFRTTGHQMVAACFAACACGLQNAMCTSHFGAVVRTTHVTGTITDIGSTTGRMVLMAFRKHICRSPVNAVERAEAGVDARKLLVLLPMWTSFFAGTFLGAFLQGKLGVYALSLPAGFTFSVGLAYMLFRKTVKTRMKSLDESKRLQKDIGNIKDTISKTEGFIAERADNIKGETPQTLRGLQEEFGQVLCSMRQVQAELEELQRGAGDEEPSDSYADEGGVAAIGADATPPTLDAPVVACLSAKE
mmetsp:Transcript_59317/g.171389  ORF Transcript_59317/g.171389 Transcript_59317/m.171389 type:complete len:453 (-) Transcript_59317:49-1407(-)